MENFGNALQSKKFRILVAEDFPISQEMAVILLEKAGFIVDAADNGQEAFDKIQQNCYDAVFMDVQMPDMDGLQATRLVRESEQAGNIHLPIIAMTAQSLQADLDVCLEAGMDAFITKPIGIEKLLSALGHWLPLASKSPLENSTIAARNQSSSNEKVPSVFSSEDEGSFLYYENEDFSENPTPIKRVDETPLNIQVALGFFMNDHGLFLKMCKDLLLQLPERMREIKQALQNRNSKDLHRFAHALKGGLENFSASPAARIAAQIETLSDEEDYEILGNLVRRLEVEVDRLNQFCKKELGLKI